ncbi:MAG: type IV secretory system conjugative DNA transfer family protein [Candidatus Peregrinibacteria bacterium]|nr:type IV secretory system conjugative DNA transfer family protein [Candidatus Peregrinibacteria bacterium]
MTPFILSIGGLLALHFLFQVYISGKQSEYNKSLPSVVLRVAVSKTNERGPIVAENIFSAIHGIDQNYTFFDYMSGRTKPRISLEIANVGNKIQFFIWMPRKLRNVVESQIYAQYPDVEIEEVDDYARQPFSIYSNMAAKQELDSTNPENPENLPAVYSGAASRDGRVAVTAEINLDEPDIYPIKRFPQFEDKLTRLATEPLAGITATLSKLNATDEQAWVQITMEPVGDWWRKRGLKCLKIVSNGLFDNIFWLHSYATNVYLARGFWKRLLLTPVFLIFWILRAGRTGSLSMTSSSDQDLREEVSRSHDREDPVSAAVDKVTRLSYGCNIRIVYIPRRENIDLAELKLNEIAGSFKQFNQPNLNSFKVTRLNSANAQILKRYQQRAVIDPMILNVEELATIYHMPSIGVGTPNVWWVNSRKLEPPHNLPIVGSVPDTELNVMGESNFRGHREKFGIKTVDRRRHIYIIGKTGMGKSVLLENMIHSDVNTGKGLAVIDPHGDLADAVIDFVPPHRTNDVVILDPSDVSHPFAFNMLEYTEDAHKRNLMASGLLGVFKKMYADSWGPRLEHILRNSLLALVEYPNTSMLGIMRILVDEEYRKKVVANVKNPMVRSFWVDEFGKMQDRMRTEAISPIQNKVGQFLSSPMIRNIVGQVKSTVNIRFMMDSGKIIIVNLSKGKIGEDNSSLLGSMLITKFQLDAMSRADTEEKNRNDFYLYVDEFQNFATDAFATILSEARKYKLNLVMANQYVAQMPEEVRDAVFGNVGTSLCFQVGFDDAEYFSNQFSEEVLPNDIITLPKYNCYTKLMIDGMPSPTFSIATLPPPEFDSEEGRREKIVRLSRERYCRPREVVEEKIARWSETKKLEAPKPKGSGEGNGKKDNGDHKKDGKQPEKSEKPAPSEKKDKR